MPEDPPSAKRPPRDPSPGWMYAVFGLGMVPVGAVICALSASSSHLDEVALATLAGALGGLILGVPLICGLAIAERFFDGSPARFIGGVVFAFASIAGLWGVAFAGCVCVAKAASLR